MEAAIFLGSLLYASVGLAFFLAGLLLVGIIARIIIPIIISYSGF